jgi:hypothetical protein
MAGCYAYVLNTAATETKILSGGLFCMGGARVAGDGCSGRRLSRQAKSRRVGEPEYSGVRLMRVTVVGIVTTRSPEVYSPTY